jgi:hypothetical protein
MYLFPQFFKNKIVQRFYETSADNLQDLISERLKFLSPKQATGCFGIFTTAHRAVVPNFPFKKDLILYLNSSRAAPKVGISASLQQAAGNSNLKIHWQEIVLMVE